jgi:hypothetical protein
MLHVIGGLGVLQSKRDNGLECVIFPADERPANCYDKEDRKQCDCAFCIKNLHSEVNQRGHVSHLSNEIHVFGFNKNAHTLISENRSVASTFFG